MGRSFAGGGFVAGCLAILAVAGCVGPEPRQADVPISATGPKPLPATQTDGQAERLVMGATSCWTGGLWSDALGEKDDPPFEVGDIRDARTAGIERRCDAVLVHLYGAVDPMQYMQLRAVEVRVVDDLRTRVRSIAANDRVDRPRAERLVQLLGAVADAERENILARAVADEVKKDEEGASSPGERATDKTFAAQALERTKGLEALLSFGSGDLSHEARAVGLLCALDRLEIARKLPKHLKVIAVGGPSERVFGVRPPEVPGDPTAPIKSGAWPGYLVDIARATGHAVPAEATEPIDRESLAWVGVLEAFADRLRVEARDVSTRTPLPLVLGRVADRLDKENGTMRALLRAEPRAEK
jgi:hypothetical protein